MELMRIRDLRKSFGRMDAVKGIGFELEEGKCVSLLGKTGQENNNVKNVIRTARANSRQYYI